MVVWEANLRNAWDLGKRPKKTAQYLARTHARTHARAISSSNALFSHAHGDPLTNPRERLSLCVVVSSLCAVHLAWPSIRRKGRHWRWSAFFYPSLYLHMAICMWPCCALGGLRGWNCWLQMGGRMLMKMHLPVCTLAMIFTQRCCNMIMQTIELNRAFRVAGVA